MAGYYPQGGWYERQLYDTPPHQSDIDVAARHTSSSSAIDSAADAKGVRDALRASSALRRNARVHILTVRAFLQDGNAALPAPCYGAVSRCRRVRAAVPDPAADGDAGAAEPGDDDADHTRSRAASAHVVPSPPVRNHPITSALVGARERPAGSSIVAGCRVTPAAQSTRTLDGLCCPTPSPSLSRTVEEMGARRQALDGEHGRGSAPPVA
jgi:hypothetical protein